MYRVKMCVGLSERQFGIGDIEQIRLLKQMGFDGFFAGWAPGTDLMALRRVADEENMLFQSVHAPYGTVNALWKPMDNTEATVETLIQCVRESAAAGVDLVVMHAFIGFTEHEPTEFGLRNFGRIVREAEKVGVKIAFENTEGEEYLAALMDHFRGNPCVGFCWDSGHEMCYNHSQDMLALYGDRLLGTHLNDNLGIRDFGGEIIYFDDLHLLPFDGVADWDDIGMRLQRHGFAGPLTFEMSRLSMPNRRDNDAYARMEIADYMTLLYARACRVATLYLRHAAG